MPPILDTDLIKRAEKLATGANIHKVNTFIHCYAIRHSAATRKGWTLYYKTLVNEYRISLKLLVEELEAKV